MSIQYVLHENSLPSSPNTFCAAVVPTRTAGLEDVVDYMVLHGTQAAKPYILAILEDYFRAITALVLDGQSVNTRNARYRATIRGKFAGLSDDFDPSRHRVVAAVNPGREFRKAIAGQAVVTKERGIVPRPFPDDLFDLESGARNATVTPGGMAQLLGDNLRFDPADPAQGVFFRGADDKVTRAEKVGKIMPGELVFLVPTLAAGTYRLEVRAVINGGSDLRKGELGKDLTVG